MVRSEKKSSPLDVRGFLDYRAHPTGMGSRPERGQIAAAFPDAGDVENDFLIHGKVGRVAYANCGLTPPPRTETIRSER